MGLRKPIRKRKKFCRLKEGSYSKIFKEDTKYAIKYGSEYVIDTLPPISQRYLEQKREHRKFDYREILSKWGTRLSWDKKIFMHKYYPWCYHNYKPRLVLQGWYNVKVAKLRYKKVYGEDVLTHIRFIKGRLALERGFTTGQSLYINGRWRKPFSKIKGSLPGDITFLKRGKTYGALRTYEVLFGYKSSRNSSKFKEKGLIKFFLYEQYGYRYKAADFYHLTKEEKLRVQELLEVIKRRKNTLYEEPDTSSPESNGNEGSENHEVVS